MSHPDPHQASADAWALVTAATKADMRVAAGLQLPSAIKVYHVEAYGNDATADGSKELPFLTPQAAYDAAWHATERRVIEIGVGSFGNITASNGWPKTLFLRGQGYSVSGLGTITLDGEPHVICSDRSVLIANIIATAAPETAGTTLDLVGIVALYAASSADGDQSSSLISVYDSSIETVTTSSPGEQGEVSGYHSRFLLIEAFTVTLACSIYGTVMAGSFNDLGGSAQASVTLP